MPNKKAAAKALRQTKKHALKNRTAKDTIKKTVKQVLRSIEAGELDKATKMLPQLSKIVDKAAKRNIIHKNKASRIKERVAKKVNTATKK